jgi:uncharacterized protein YbjQ (UPF0145 family)
MRGIVQKVVEESDDRVVSSGISFDPSKNVTMTTQNMITSLPVVNTEFIAGREIEETIGILFAEGQHWFGTSKERVTTALAQAWQSLQGQAYEIGADAVINVQVSSAGVRGFWGISFGGQTATIILTGTAVKLK